MSYAFLVADKREREVIPHLRPLLKDGAFKAAACRNAAAGAAGLLEETIHTGDYLLCRKTVGEAGVKIVACFERKSISDFVSSVGDGRYENRRKMLELREKTGCQLYYIIEGKAFPKPEWNIGHGMKYKTILTTMTTLPLMSGIHVLQTKDTQHTAERLRDFVRELNQECEPYWYPLGIGACPADARADGVAAGDVAADGAAAAVATKAGSLVPEMVTGVYEKDPDTLCMEMWSKLSGISTTTAKIIVGMCSMAEFVRQEGPAVKDIKTSTGRALKKQARDSLALLLRGDAATAAKVLSGIIGVSRALATQLLDATPADPAFAGAGGKLRTICALSARELAQYQTVQKSRTVRLGEKRAAKILRTLRWRSGDEERAQDAAPAAAAAPFPQISDEEFDDLFGLSDMPEDCAELITPEGSGTVRSAVACAAASAVAGAEACAAGAAATAVASAVVPATGACGGVALSAFDEALMEYL